MAGSRPLADIPQTVMQTSAAAGSSAVLLHDARNTMTRSGASLAERDITGEEPRLGVFVCRCGINIGSVVLYIPMNTITTNKMVLLQLKIESFDVKQFRIPIIFYELREVHFLF